MPHAHRWTENLQAARSNEVVWSCPCGAERWVCFEPDGTVEYSPSYFEGD